MRTGFPYHSDPRIMDLRTERQISKLLDRRFDSTEAATYWLRTPHPDLGVPPGLRIHQGWAEPVIRLLEAM